MLVQYVAQQAAALGVDGRPGRVLAAWGDDGCPSASGQRPGELMGDGTALIDAHGLGLQPECADQVRDARPARIFDGHPVARPQLCLQDAFDAIERAAGDGDVPVDAVGGEVGLGQLDQPAELVSRIKTGEGRDAFIRDGSVLIRDYGRLMPAGNCRCLGIGLASAGWLTGLVCRMVRQLN